MVEFLFLDLDDTILDFHKAEGIAIRKTIASFGVDPTDAVCARYSEINKAHWEMLERKELTREQVVVQRFAKLFAELGYHPMEITAVDMFPRTGHVECVLLLSKNAGERIKVEVNVEELIR